ncbi:MAG: AMIN domain-containing protein, partial [Wohlfahrtiimonas sp.]
MKGYQLGIISLALSSLILTTASAQRLTALESVTLANGDVELRYHFDKNITAPKSFYLDDKNLLVVDFPSTGFNQVLQSRSINNNVVKDINNLYANQKVRSTVQLKSNTTYSIASKSNEVIVTLSSSNPYAVNQESWDNSVQSNVSNVEVQQPTSKDVGF